MNSKILNNIAIAAILISLAVTTRIIPHLWNFTAVGAIFLFSTFYFKDRSLRFLIPITVMLCSDLCLYWLKGTPFAGLGIYLCLMLYIPVSAVLIKKVKFTSELLKRSLKLTVSNAGVRSVDKKGSFDQFIKTVKSKYLSPRLKKLKKNIITKSA